MRTLVILLALIMPLTASAESSLPFMKDMVGDRSLPRPWGIGVDFYTMDQDYDIDNLIFVLPGVSVGDPSEIGVTNEVQHFDIKGDVWLLPFLNVFGVLGRVDVTTTVDFSTADIVGLPPGVSFGKLPVNFDGWVYGGGVTLAFGGERWFTSLTSTYTKTDTSSGLNSTVRSISHQPRVGLIHDNWRFWLGAMYLDVDENHDGVFELPYIGDVPFAVDLVTRDHWNYGVGVSHSFSDRAELSFEVGVGDRTHTLFNFTGRF